MARLTAFFRRPRADQRLLLLAAMLHIAVAIAVRVLPFGRVRGLLDRVATLRRRPRRLDDMDVRIVQAVRAAASVLPGANCLTEALAAQCLLARHRCEATLCFGVSRLQPAGRPFDAHAWLERGGSRLVGGRAIAYEPLHHPSRCASSPPPR